LKYLKREALSSSRMKRFKNELGFCMKNSHPNIISIEDWGLAEIDGDEVPFYVMPLFPDTLRSLMRKQTGREVLLGVFMQVLEGVGAAHNAGVWHRDLKPENILYDPQIDRAVVTDFGIAHFPEDLLNTAIETQPSERLANFRYAAPEQRSNGAVDTRADIYALGLILYELLTGEVLQGTHHRAIASFHPDLAFLDPVVEKMLAQSPDDRPANIVELNEKIQEQLYKKDSDSVSTESIKETLMSAARTSPVAYAWYETKGKNAKKADIYIRRTDSPDVFLYEDSFGVEEYLSADQAAIKLVSSDKGLVSQGYVRMTYANLSGSRLFDI